MRATHRDCHRAFGHACHNLSVSALLLQRIGKRAWITVANDYVPIRLYRLHLGVQLRAENRRAHIDLVDRRQVEEFEEERVADERSKNCWYLAPEMA